MGVLRPLFSWKGNAVNKDNRAAAMMRELSDEKRDALIEAADNVIDARVMFEKRAKQVAIAHAYRKPKSPEGAA